MLPLPQSSKPLDVYVRLVSDHQLRPHITLQSAVMSAADQNQTLIFGLLFGCLAMLLLHNLVRYAYSRSRSSLWLAICEGLLDSACCCCSTSPAPGYRTGMRSRRPGLISRCC